MSVYGASLLVWVALLQGAFSQTETHMHGEKVRHKIATKRKPAEKGGGHCPLVHTALWRAPHAFRKWAKWHDECIVGDGAIKIQIIIRWLRTRQVVKVAGQFVKFEWGKVESQVRVIERAEKRSTPQG